MGQGCACKLGADPTYTVMYTSKHKHEEQATTGISFGATVENLWKQKKDGNRARRRESRVEKS